MAKQIKSSIELAMEKMAKLPKLTKDEIRERQEKEYAPQGQTLARELLTGVLAETRLEVELFRHTRAKAFSGRIVRIKGVLWKKQPLCQAGSTSKTRKRPPRCATPSRAARSVSDDYLEEAAIGDTSVKPGQSTGRHRSEDYERQKQCRNWRNALAGSKTAENASGVRDKAMGVSGSAIRLNPRENPDEEALDGPERGANCSRRFARRRTRSSETAEAARQGPIICWPPVSWNVLERPPPGLGSPGTPTSGERSTMPGPMTDGIKVVELGVWVAGPATGAILADWGAEVIKIEPPGMGDPGRLFGKMLGGDLPFNPVFENDNRGKRGIVLDISSKDGKEIALELIDGADVFVSNVRPAALARLGLDPETLLARNSRLIYGLITGYGLEGPDADRPAYDIAGFWARSGVAAALTKPGDSPSVSAGGHGRSFCS